MRAVRSSSYAISLRRTAFLKSFKKALFSTSELTCAMTFSGLPSARLLAALAVACLTAAPVSHAMISDSLKNYDLSFRASLRLGTTDSEGCQWPLAP